MPLNLLQDWCRGEHLNTQRSMLILGIPEDCSEDEFEETLHEALKHLGRYRIIGKMFRREENAQAFLVELARDFDYALVPREIEGKGGPWEVVIKPPHSDDEFLNRLNHFLEEERRTVSDMNRVLGTHSNYSPTKTTISADFWVWAQTLGAVMQPLLEQMLYRELRVFSGNTISIPGSLAFDSWLEHTTEMLQMWQVPEVEKRRRLMECLRGPALQVVNVLRANNAAITVKECLEALRQVFGSVDNRKIAQLKFCKAYQEPGEKVSSFVVRLETLLQKALEKNAISRKNVNQTRLKRILGGAILSAKLREKLKMLKQRRRPPGFLALVKLFREEEEEWEANRGSERSCYEGLELGLSPSNIGSEERALFVPAFGSVLEARPYQGSHRRRHRRRGQHRKGGVPRDDSQGTRKQNYDTFCYSCGEDGHIRVHCFNPSNRTLVKQKRQAAMEKGNRSWAWEKSHPKPKTK